MSLFDRSGRPFARAVLLIPVIASPLFAQRPAWVAKRPLLPDYYVGIGVTQKNVPAERYIETAKNAALNDIASQITVSISSEVLRKLLENNSTLQEEFQSEIRASARAELDNVELVDTYESSEEYWVYCRLSKSEYAARRAERMKNAAELSLDLFSAARKSETGGNTSRALSQYAQALGPIEKYLAEPLQAQYGGTNILLVNEICRSLQRLMDRIDLKVAEGTREARVGRPLKKPFRLSAALDDGRTPVAALPLKFAFVRGSGEMLEKVLTDARGSATCEIQKITSADRIQIVEARVDMAGLLAGESSSEVVLTILKGFAAPTARLVLNVSGVEVYIDAEESMFGQQMAQNRIEPVVKSKLGEQGFTFVLDPGKAALVIRIKADARKGSEAYGIAFAYVSTNVSVLDLETGQEIYKSAIQDVKEGSDTFEKAALKGFSAAADRIAGELLPKLVQKVQQ